MSPLRIATFLAIVSTVLFGAHYYIWARLVRDTGLSAPWATVAAWTLGMLGTLIVGGFLLMRAGPRSVASPVMWIVFTWIGLAFFLLVLLATADLGRLALEIARRVATPGAPDPARRQFLARMLGGAVGVGAVGLSAVGLSGARDAAVMLKKVKIALTKLPAASTGYRIVQISDVHVGPTIGREFIEDIVARVNALEPDLIAITGDLVDGSVSQLGALVMPLKDLRAKDGVFFITGNHEYYSGVDEWLPWLRGLGIRVLSNERVRIGEGEGFDLAGVNDFTGNSFGHGHEANLPRALAGRDPARPLILLAHQPRAVHEAEPLGVDLQLSGHTHGGQIFPFNFIVKLVEPYIAGLYKHGRAQLYVSRGTGYWGPPMRLGAPAEITEIELASA